MAKKENIITKHVDKVIRNHVQIKQEPGDIKNAAFNHTVLCQTCLPYRNPGDKLKWESKQGKVSLLVKAGYMYNPTTARFDPDPVGIPYGPKSRLLLSYFNTEAIRTQSKEIHVEDTMTGFIKSMGLDTNGRNIEEVKTQLRRLATSTISLGYTEDGISGLQVDDLKIIKGFEISFPKNSNQRTLWPGRIWLSDAYFNSLIKHAIPLDIRALRGLANNAMALDIYAWLSQRLHRIPLGKPQFVTWFNVKEQFGIGYDRIDKFKEVFRKTVYLVLSQYPTAKFVEEKNKGWWLHMSPAPITKGTLTLGQ